jgi:sodium/bile acid cotransporter 7
LCALILSVGLALITPTPLDAATERLQPPVVIACALFLMAWTMPSRSLGQELRRPWAALWAMAISYGFLPSAAWLIGIQAPADVRIGLLLAASVPCTLASCVLWTRLAGGNEATALLTVLGCTLSSWFLTTFWLATTTGARVEIPVAEMMLDLATTLIIPVALGQGLRLSAAVAGFADRHKKPLGVASQLLILAIVLKAAAAVGLKIRERADYGIDVFLLGAGLAFGLHLLALYVGLWSSSAWGIDRPRALAVAFAGSQKTLPVSLFLFNKYFMTDFPLAVVPLLCFHVGQLLLDTLIAERMKRDADTIEVVEAL